MLTRILMGLFIAAPALGDEVVMADITGDGAAEHIQLVETNTGWQHLIIDSDPGGLAILPAISQSNSMAGQSTVAITPSGSVVFERAHLGIGRHKWILTITIAHRDDTFKIAGITYVYYDSLDTTSGRRCDLNLLTGNGTFERAEGATTTFTHDGPAPDAHNWDVAHEFWNGDLIPKDCFG